MIIAAICAAASFAQTLAAYAAADDSDRAAGSRALLAALPEKCSSLLHIQHARWSGMPISFVLFESDMGIEELAHKLFRAQPILTDLSVIPGAVILSGQGDHTQWIAQLQQTSPGRIAGLVSVLDWSRASHVRASRRKATRFLARAMPIMDFEWHENRESVAERMWLVPGERTALSGEVALWLRRRGWSAEKSEADRNAVRDWRRGLESLRLAITPIANGAVVYVHRRNFLP